jgi:radical SAM superfamily enzyme YgiQ (UPF0313 family)
LAHDRLRLHRSGIILGGGSFGLQIGVQEAAIVLVFMNDKAFKSASHRVGKKQYTVPYFIASHPGSGVEEMIDLALFLKRLSYRVDR